MKTFQEFVAEDTMEIPTTKAKEYKKDLEKLGVKVTKADDEGLIVKTNDMKKLHGWMKDNGWSDQEIKDLH